MADTIWIARHANRQDFADPDWASTAERPHDPGLAPDGHTQAEQLARRLAEESITRIVASPFLRTVQTAHPVAEALDRPMRLEPGLGEWLNPEWFDAAPAIRSPDALAEAFPRIDLNSAPCVTPSFPETRDEAFARIGDAARCLAERFDGAGDLLLVGHGATVQGILLGLVGDVEDAGCPLCSVSRLVRDGGRWTIATRNDTSHLDHTGAADRFH
jgi:broad specificity phosphatase PhoE